MSDRANKAVRKKRNQSLEIESDRVSGTEPTCQQNQCPFLMVQELSMPPVPS
jgi:hypothetical protein